MTKEATAALQLAQTYLRIKRRLLSQIREERLDTRRLVYATVEAVNHAEGRSKHIPFWIRGVLNKVASALEKEAHR